MTWTALDLPGCYTRVFPRHGDARGRFAKPFRASLVREVIADFEVAEVFTSTSAKNVLRGMHFQIPPHAHHKVIGLTQGAALDVLVDLRPGPGFGKTASVRMQADETFPVVVMPIGIAHGFLSLSDDCTMTYVVSTEHAPEQDRGVLWSSLEFDWPVSDLGQAGPIVSDRDRAFPPLSAFNTCFDAP